MKRLFRHHRRDRGAVIPIVALMLPVLMVMTAFAVDLGRQRVLRRDLQADADVIALDLVRLANGRTEAEILGDPTFLAFVNGSLTRNGVDPVATVAELAGVVEYGTWDGTADPQFATAGDPPNAVRVTLDGLLDYYFQPGTGSSSRVATASRTDRAGFSIGSYAAAVSAGSSPILNHLIGDALDLGVLGYDGLATADLSLLDIAAEMGGLTPEELFSGDVSVRDVLAASAEILRRADPSSAQVAVLDGILSSSTSSDLLADVALSDALRVATGGEEAAAQSTVNLLDLLAASAFLANGTNGLSIPNVALGPPGMQLQGMLTLIQAPVTAYGPIGTTAGTSQLDATLVSTTGTVDLGNFTASTLNSVLPGSGDLLCSLLLLGPLLCPTSRHAVSAELVATVGLDLASAVGTIDHIRCTNDAEELGIAVDSQLVSTSMGVAVKLKSGTNELGTIHLSVVSTRPGGAAAVDFVIPPDAFDVYKDASPNSGSLAGPTSLGGTSQLGSLLTSAFSAQLDGIVQTANDTVITPLASLMGLSFASARVAARSVDCGGGMLVG